MKMIWPTDILSIESWALIGTIVVLFRYYLHRKWSVLKKLNIPHNPPSIFKLGNLLEAFGKGAFTYGLENKKKFGPVYGHYMGTAPAIVVHDTEIIRRIFVKEFSNFPTREIRQIRLSGKELNTSVVSVRGPQWKRIRSTMSPMFSGSKLRHMSGMLENCANNLVKFLENRLEKGDPSFKVREQFANLSLDMVLSAAFSTDVNTQMESKKEPEITKYAKQLFQFSLLSPVILIVLMVPSLIPLLEKFNLTTMKKAPLNYFKNVTNMIMKRKEDDPHGSKNRVDFMQLLLDNRVSEEEAKKEPEKGMTKTEIVGNSMVMILAGYENTANTITFLAYNLAVHPEIQAKVQKEMDDMIQEGGRFDYDGINSLKFLDMCLNESLRLYTPIILNTRASKEAITVNGLNIPAKFTVHFPVFALAHDPEYWEDPYEFKPERMRDMNQIDPMYFQPFGAGPRNCIGMRFALLEVKMAIAKLLYNFNLEPTENTPKPPLELVMGTGVRSKKELFLKVSSRKPSESN